MALSPFILPGRMYGTTRGRDCKIMSFDEKYFSTHTYQDVSFARYSQYWWSNRFYAILARRYGRRGARLLEIGSGLGHLVGQLGKRVRNGGDGCEPLGAPPIARRRRSTPRMWGPARKNSLLQMTFLGSSSSSTWSSTCRTLRKRIAELGRVMAPGGVLILATPNLASLLKPWKGEKWIGYQDPTHISLKPPEEWLDMIGKAGFRLLKVFSDGFWDVPYIQVVPKILQKLFFGSLGGFQAMAGLPFLPMRWGESIMVVARKHPKDRPLMNPEKKPPIEEEPSLLDYLKSRLRFWERGQKIEIPAPDTTQATLLKKPAHPHSGCPRERR